MDRFGIHDSRFKNNVTGDDWFKSFIKRNNLTQRSADNVKPARVEIDALNVNFYFDELQHAVEDVPASHIYNYGETNVTDNPCSKTVVCQRGLKSVERKTQYSKSATSIMYCDSANGTFIPPMVVYKAQNCYVEWTTDGQVDCIYVATKSGWLDSRFFKRWFVEIFLVHVKDQQGIKVVIGDNLASLFTTKVVQL